MNHRERIKSATNRYERARAMYESKIQQYQDAEQQTKSDIANFDLVINGSLQSLAQASRNPQYGDEVKAAIDNIPGREIIDRYYGFGAVGGNQTGRRFGDINDNAPSGIGYAAGTGAAGIGTGIGAVAGAYGLAGAIGVASTGTAIGGLSGAAATGASLAWLGGGALAAGGLGIAGGMLALTGIGLIPLAAAGVVGGVLYKQKNKKRADALEAEVQEKIAAMTQAQQGMTRSQNTLAQISSVVRHNTAEVKILNNRYLGPAIQSANAASVVATASQLVTAIRDAITEAQQLVATAPGRSP